MFYWNVLQYFPSPSQPRPQVHLHRSPKKFHANERLPKKENPIGTAIQLIHPKPSTKQTLNMELKSDYIQINRKWSQTPKLGINSPNKQLHI